MKSYKTVRSKIDTGLSTRTRRLRPSKSKLSKSGLLHPGTSSIQSSRLQRRTITPNLRLRPPPGGNEANYPQSSRSHKKSEPLVKRRTYKASVSPFQGTRSPKKVNRTRVLHNRRLEKAQKVKRTPRRISNPSTSPYSQRKLIVPKSFNAENYDSSGNYISNKAARITIPETIKLKSPQQLDQEFENRLQDRIERMNKRNKYSGKIKQDMDTQELNDLQNTQFQIDQNTEQIQTLDQLRKNQLMGSAFSKLLPVISSKLEAHLAHATSRLKKSVQYYQLMEMCSQDLREINMKRNFLRTWDTATKKSKLK